MDNVSNIASPQDDGAGEKLVDEKNGHNSKGIEVKYMTPTSQNGDAKIDIENLKTFAGMGKEELMKFANDPFWVRTRWFLFVLFWLLWVAMLAGAISIIVLAPKCAPPIPREWWEQSPLYKANVASFTKDENKLQGDLKGFTNKLDYLSSLGVETIVLSNILKVSDKNSDGDEEFKTIAPSFGTLEDLKALISAAKDKGLKLLLTLVPNHSSLNNTIFAKSASNDKDYAAYYVWAPPGKEFTSDGKPSPPNNWLSKTGGSAWQWHDGRKQFYLHQFDTDEPEFNFRNPNVVKYFNDVMQFWLNLGISGFYLERTPYLIEDEALANENKKRNIGSATHTDYEYYNHIHTENQPELVHLLSGWKELVMNSSGILVVDNVSLNTNRSVAHVIVKPQILDRYPDFLVDNLYNVIDTTLAANPWPAWQVERKDEPEGSNFTKALLLTSMLLPGIPVIQAGQELGLSTLTEMPWHNTSTENQKTDIATQQKNEHSMYSAYKEVIRARSSASILHGTLKLHIFNGTSVFAYTRIKSGNPYYLVVFNTGLEETVVDARQLDSVPEELTQLLITSDISSEVDEKKVESKTIYLPGRAVAVFSYVDKAKE